MVVFFLLSHSLFLVHNCIVIIARSWVNEFHLSIIRYHSLSQMEVRGKIRDECECLDSAQCVCVCGRDFLFLYQVQINRNVACTVRYTHDPCVNVARKVNYPWKMRSRWMT